jgi:hypothetical protein
MPLDATNPLVELTVVALHRAGDLRQQLIDGGAIGELAPHM